MIEDFKYESDTLTVGYSQTEIPYDVLKEFFEFYGYDPTLLGNVMLLPKSLVEQFCEVFGIVFLDKVTEEMCQWCKDNIQGFFSIHAAPEQLSQKYIIIQDVQERILFKLIWS